MKISSSYGGEIETIMHLDAWVEVNIGRVYRPHASIPFYINDFPWLNLPTDRTARFPHHFIVPMTIAYRLMRKVLMEHQHEDPS